MSLFDYLATQDLAGHSVETLVMAAMKRADDGNLARLRDAFPEVFQEVVRRYNAPGGRLPGDADWPEYAPHARPPRRGKADRRTPWVVLPFGTCDRCEHIVQVHAITRFPVSRAPNPEYGGTLVVAFCPVCQDVSPISVTGAQWRQATLGIRLARLAKFREYLATRAPAPAQAPAETGDADGQ